MKEIAKKLLEIKAVDVNVTNKFTWSSGIKSPIYVDNRLINSFPRERKIIEKKLAQVIKKNFDNVDVIVGTATAGISHAAYVSHILNLPMIYVRPTPKKHGQKNQIEGQKNLQNQRTIVIEDLLSTGASVLKVIKTLEKHKVKVLGVVSIFTYGLKQVKNNLKNLNYFSLTNLDEVLEVAQEMKYINFDDIFKVKKFIDNLQEKK